MHFDLKSASFPDAHFRAVGKAQVPEPPTERQDVLSKRAAEVGGMAPGVKATKVAVHLSFSVADSGWVADDQRSVRCDHSAAMSGLGLDPTQNLVRIFQASHASQIQTVLVIPIEARPLGFPYQPRSTPIKTTSPTWFMIAGSVRPGRQPRRGPKL
jgi:hypothetical protein